MILNNPQQLNFKHVNSVGIAIRQYAGEQNHLAILYVANGDSDEPKILHLGDQHCLKNEQPDNSYLWIDLGDDFDAEIDLPYILAYVRDVARVNTKESGQYGLDTNTGCFDPMTGMLKSEAVEEVGLTCATFVLEVFKARGFELVQWDSWPLNDQQNINWHYKVISHLRSLFPKKVTASYFNKQLLNIGNRRYLPQDVAAATQKEIPASKDSVNELSSDIHVEITHYTTNYYATQNLN